MSVSNLANSPIELSLGGQSYKVKRISMSEIFGHAESKIVTEYLKNVQVIAGSLSGKDKLDYLATATKGIPKGGELNASANEYLESVSGMLELFKIGLNKLQKVDDDELNSAFLNSTTEEKQILLGYLCGSDAMKTDDIKQDIGAGSSEKKTI